MMTAFFLDRVPSHRDTVWLRGAAIIQEFQLGRRLSCYCRWMHASEFQKAYDEAEAAMIEFGAMPLHTRFEVVAAMVACEAKVDARLFPWPWPGRFIGPTARAWLLEYPNDWRAHAALGEWEKVLELSPSNQHARKRAADYLFWELEDYVFGPYNLEDKRRKILEYKEKLETTISGEADDELRLALASKYNVDDWVKDFE
jgi:hypothetical protein